MIDCDSRTITHECVVRALAAETRRVGLQVDSMQFYADLLSEILLEKVHHLQGICTWDKAR